MEMLRQQFYNVSREESEKIRKTTDHHGLPHSTYELTLSVLHEKREKENINCKESIIAGPSVHLLSVHFVPDTKIDHEKQLTIYGRIYSEFTSCEKTIVHNLYNRKCEDAQVLSQTGSLALTNLDCESWPLMCMPLHNTRIVVDVCVGGKTLGVRYISCAEDTTDFEQVKLEYVPTELGVLALRYIAMPFSVYAHVEVRFFHKQKLDGIDHRSLNVKGKIVARYGNTYGDYNSEECTLFEKQSNEFQQVGFDLERRSMRLSRCWVALPVYSSLILDLELLEFGSDRKILKEILEFRVDRQHVSYAEFIVDDVLVEIGARWFSPMPQGSNNEKKYSMELDDEASDEEISLQGTSKDDSDDEQMNESCVPETSSNPTRSWQLRPHRNSPIPSSAVEIFSIFVGREKFKALEVYGCIEVSSLASTFYGFNGEAKDAFGLLEESKTIPVLNGSLDYDDCDSLKMKIDLKDVESRLNIRGHVDWDCRTLEFGTQWLNKQLCSVVEGKYGFAAIHYSIFPEAVQANVLVLCTPKLKNGNGHVDGSPKVYGSIVAQYNNFDYTSRYAKDYYRVILFQRNVENSVQTSGNGMISLSRSVVVVPLSSSLVIEVNMWIGDDQVLLRSNTEVRIGTNDITMENNDYSLHIYLKWVEVSN